MAIRRGSSWSVWPVREPESTGRIGREVQLRVSKEGITLRHKLTPAPD